MISVFVADDHPVVRAGIIGMLQSFPDLTVCGEASDGIEAMESLKTVKADVLLTDLRMPRMDGVQLTQAVLAMPDPPQVIVLTTYDSDADILRAVEAGATGYLLKDAPKGEIVEAMRAAVAGRVSLSPQVAAALMSQARTSTPERLSAREQQVLGLVSNGQTNAQISRSLGISLGTVKTHLEHCYAKLQAADRAEAVAKALSAGLLGDSSTFRN